MFSLYFISRGLELWSINHNSIYENIELKAFKNINFLGEISNIWPKHLLEANFYKNFESWWSPLLTTLQWTNTTSVISKWGTFSPFSFLGILLLMLPSNVIISGVKRSRKYLVLFLNVTLPSTLFAYILIGAISPTAWCFLMIY